MMSTRDPKTAPTRFGPHQQFYNLTRRLRRFPPPPPFFAALKAFENAKMASLIIPPVLSSPRQDATDLYKAFKGFGCDSTTIINILAHRDGTMRALIQQEYKAMYSEDLIDRVKSELSGNMEQAVVLWIHDPVGRDAIILNRAITGDIIDLPAATDIICSRTPSQIQMIKQAYWAKFNAHIEHDIGLEAGGDHKKMLLAYIGKPRYEGPEIDPNIVAHDAKHLFKAGEKKVGTDEGTFIGIFSERSRAHLAAVASAYHHSYGNSLEKALKNETSGLFLSSLLAILRCAENPAKYFAKELCRAMKGIGTSDDALIRIVVTRTEIDMQYIKIEYQKKYKKTLVEAIHSETSGNYRKFLLALVGPNH